MWCRSWARPRAPTFMKTSLVILWRKAMRTCAHPKVPGFMLIRRFLQRTAAAPTMSCCWASREQTGMSSLFLIFIVLANVISVLIWRRLRDMCRSRVWRISRGRIFLKINSLSSISWRRIRFFVFSQFHDDKSPSPRERQQSFRKEEQTGTVIPNGAERRFGI